MSEAHGDLREQRLSSEQKETLEKGWCLLSLFVKNKAVVFCFHCSFLENLPAFSCSRKKASL